MTPRLKEKYQKEVIPKMKQIFGYKNNLAVPRLEKVVFNVGLGKSLEDPKFIEAAMENLERISGQKPILTKAKKSISNFKIRKGMIVGAKVTLRGNRMYDFVDKLINITLPRIGDFRGLPEKNLNQLGNLTIGIKEHIVFPEIRSDEVEKIHGLEVSISTTAKDRKESLTLFKLLGFPFQEK